MTAELKSTREDRTMVLTLSNPSQRNALAPQMYAAGIEALGGAESDPEVRCVVLVGEGTWFCAGGSLQRLQANRTRPPQAQAESIEALHGWIEALRTFPKPVIAAVEGAAAGAGFSLALACDFIVSARDAVFSTAYVNVALSPDGGLSWHLAQTLPRQLVNEWLMLGGRIGAARLHELGVVNRLSESGQALSSALALAQELADHAPNALASIKSLVSEAPQVSLNAHLGSERDHFVRNLHHANAGLGIAAFLTRSRAQYD